MVDIFPTLLTKEQVEQLCLMRSRLSLPDVMQFPKVRIAGDEMPNVVPEAGIFTAKIKRRRKIVNLVVMLSTQNAIQEFEKRCYRYGASPIYFWAKGHLLPPRQDRCYSVLIVTEFRFCGEKIEF